MEKETYGFNHSEVGGWLLGRWGLPEEVVVPAAEHNGAAANAGPRHLIIITNTASMLANHIQAGTSELALDSSGVEPLKWVLGLEKEQLVYWEHLVRSRGSHLRVLRTA
jgi:HD-like signal output (HDOD) protein